MARPQPLARRQGVQSVGIGLSVLEALAGFDRPAKLSEVASSCNLSPSQTHRYLSSLIRAGMAQQDSNKGRYDLGPGALQLGLGALSRIDTFANADAALKEFALETDRTILLATLGPSGPVIIRLLMGLPPVTTSLAVGSSLPLLRSATGHTFLAFSPERQTRSLILRESRAALKMPSAEIKALRSRVRSQGYSTASGTVIPGLRATAVPIFNLQGEGILAATVLGNEAFDPIDDEAIRLKLAAVCRRVTISIGGTFPF